MYALVGLHVNVNRKR